MCYENKNGSCFNSNREVEDEFQVEVEFKEAVERSFKVDRESCYCA